MSLLLLYATALLLGSIHALEPDHMAAVTSFAVRRPRPMAALRFGVRWGFGHGAAIFLVGGVVILLGVQLPEVASHWLERSVGVMLVGLGAWTLFGARQLHAHTHHHGDGHTHTHLHSHALHGGHDHGHAVTAVGLLHGLAGTGAAVGYLLVFGIGTVSGMAVYALLAGAALQRATLASERAGRALGVITGIVTTAVGFMWLLG